MPMKLEAWDIAAQVRLERQIHKGAFLIVEGPNDDKVLSRFSHDQRCSIVIAFGKPNVVGALDLLEEEGFPGET
jgi:5S rRNA maturation endonuclease (ribonuclease M5)